MDRNIKIIEKELEGIELDEDDTRLIKWISDWDLWTVNQFVEIIKKCRKTEDTGLAPEEIMNRKKLTGWIPVEERLPKKSGRYMATIKHYRWISDYDSKLIPDSEKIEHPEIIATYEVRYNAESGEWCYMNPETDGEIDFTVMGVEEDLSVPVPEMIAWMPLPEPYLPETLREEGAESTQGAAGQVLQSAT